MTIRLPELYDTYEEFINDLQVGLNAGSYHEVTRSEYFLDKFNWIIMRNKYLESK
jgi:hypothetical protein